VKQHIKDWITASIMGAQKAKLSSSSSLQHEITVKTTAGSTWGTNKKTLFIIYRTLIQSLIDYGLRAYNSAPESTKID